jgi:hypothetical protein
MQLDVLTRERDGAAEDVRAIVLSGTGSIFSAGVGVFWITGGEARRPHGEQTLMTLFGGGDLVAGEAGVRGTESVSGQASLILHASV